VRTKFLIGRSEFDRWLERDRYVKEQMGHSSIQVTVDVYGHLIPGANIAWADALDSATSP
jgi:integrase